MGNISLHIMGLFVIHILVLNKMIINLKKLKEFFEEKYKSVVSAKIVTDNISKVSKGYGFVKFSNPAESNKAINEMNGKYLCGRPIKVK